MILNVIIFLYFGEKNLKNQKDLLYFEPFYFTLKQLQNHSDLSH